MRKITCENIIKRFTIRDEHAHESAGARIILDEIKNIF